MYTRIGYSAWLLSEEDRDQLARDFPPKYAKFVGHHVTYKFGVLETDPMPPRAKKYQIIGYADSGDGLEALVVAIDGQTERADGSTYHITWSHDPNYKPRDSNALVQRGYEKLPPETVQMEPHFFAF